MIFERDSLRILFACTADNLSGDLKKHQQVSKPQGKISQGNGKAKKVFKAFLKKHKKTNLILDVRSNNKKAIRFYRKNGFKKVDETSFGKDMKGIVMVRKAD